MKSSDRGRNDAQGLIVSVTIGPDGRMFFHDLPADLLPVACKLCPGNRGLKARLRAAKALKKGKS